MKKIINAIAMACFKLGGILLSLIDRDTYRIHIDVKDDTYIITRAKPAHKAPFGWTPAGVVMKEDLNLDENTVILSDIKYNLPRL